MRLLYAEDEEDLNKVVTKKLTEEGFSVDSCFDGKEAIDNVQFTEYDAAILDIMMPHADGFAVLKELRKLKKNTPVLFLTARDSIEDRVTGLDSGANDYLVKPFHFRELEARIRALLRTSYNKSDDIIRLESQDITIYLNKKQVQKNGENIPLTPKEYAIFEYLCLNKDALISTDELLEHNVDMNANDTSSVIKVHIAAIRKKLGSDVIKNTRGMGYTVND